MHPTAGNGFLEHKGDQVINRHNAQVRVDCHMSFENELGSSYI